MYKDDETRRVLYEVPLEQRFKKMPEEEKNKVDTQRSRGMSRHIDAEWLLNFFVEFPDDYTLTIGNLRAVINDSPMTSGYWAVKPGRKGEFRCSKCGKIIYADCSSERNYCPNCGSKNKINYLLNWDDMPLKEKSND